MRIRARIVACLVPVMTVSVFSHCTPTEPKSELFEVTGKFDVFHSKSGCWNNGIYDMYCDIPNPIDEPFTGALTLLGADSAHVQFQGTSFEGSRQGGEGSLAFKAILVHGSWIEYPNEILLFQGTVTGDNITGTVSYSSGYGGPSRQSKTGVFTAVRR